MPKFNGKTLSIFFILFVSCVFWHLYPVPDGLTKNGWQSLIIFTATIGALILNVFPMGVTTLLALLTGIVTSTFTLEKALSGFSQSIVWLVVCAFFIARTVISTGLGTRIAYFFISRFGKTPIGIAYSIIFTEFCISPMIPSATSRGGGIIYPIAKAVMGEYNSQLKDDSRIGRFFTMICLHSNIITSSMFLTAMAGNPVAQKIASNYGVEMTWFNWAYGAIVPGLVSLILLPFVVKIFCKIPSNLDNSAVMKKAKDGLVGMGKMTSKELITAATFVGLILMWVFEGKLGISATTTAMLGVSVLLITNVLKWNDITAEKSAWDIFIWFSILVTIANILDEQNATVWAGLIISESLNGLSPLMTGAVVCLCLFFGHYMFASITVYFTAMFGVFLKILMDAGLPGLPSAYALVFAIMLSSGFTHYGISSAPVYFSGGYMSVQEWWQKSFGITLLLALVWLFVSAIWWKVIG